MRNGLGAKGAVGRAFYLEHCGFAGAVFCINCPKKEYNQNEWIGP